MAMTILISFFIFLISSKFNFRRDFTEFQVIGQFLVDNLMGYFLIIILGEKGDNEESVNGENEQRIVGEIANNVCRIKTLFIEKIVKEEYSILQRKVEEHIEIWRSGKYRNSCGEFLIRLTQRVKTDRRYSDENLLEWFNDSMSDIVKDYIDGKTILIYDNIKILLEEENLEKMEITILDVVEILETTDVEKNNEGEILE